jgi:tetratricopeptide (TPR) repeat protein
MSYEQLLKEMPLSKVDSLAGVYRIHNLKGRWPFNNTEYQVELPANSVEEVLARKLAFEQVDWMTIHKNLFAFYEENNQLPEASKITEAMVLENPTVPQFYEIAAKLKMELKNYDESLFYSQQLFNLSPSFDKAKYLFVAYLKLDEPSKALPFLNYAISNNTEGSNLSSVKASVDMIIQLENSLKSYPSNVVALMQIANLYMQMQNIDGAVKYFDLALKIDPKNKDAQQNLKQLNELNQQ